jgi:hypothetical protein
VGVVGGGYKLSIYNRFVYLRYEDYIRNQLR